MGSFVFLCLSKFLVAIFFLGVVGSCVVLVITFIEDGILIFERDEQKVVDSPAVPVEDAARQSHAV